MQSKEIRGGTLRVVCVGAGKPALIFVHGFGCDGSDWAAQVQALSSEFRVVTLDLPGHGESGAPATMDVGTFARAVIEVKTAYCDGGCVLIGHSLGSRIILEAFRLSPAGVAGLVLLENNLVSGGDAEAAVRILHERLATTSVHDFLRVAFEAMFGPTSVPSLKCHVLARLSQMDAGVAEALLLGAVSWEAAVAELLRGIKVPLLMMHSTCLDENFKWRSLEPGMTTPWTELVRREVPAAELSIVPGVGHFLQIEAAERVNARIGDFARRVRS